MNLTVVYITSRFNPELKWFTDSLWRQRHPDDNIQITVVALQQDDPSIFAGPDDASIVVVPPKPNVWQGKHRLTKQDWWGIANARNTGICLCRTDWIAFTDDRCIADSGWLPAIKEAEKGNYAVFGSYEKRVGMTVEGGAIKEPGTVIGIDARLDYVNKHRGGAAPTPAPGEWCYGCTSAMPLEWALKLNGFDEFCDGLGMEDVCFGLMLQNNGLETKFDHRMKIIEDRTPEFCGPVILRTDKGISPNDKSHALLGALRHRKEAAHPINLRQIRQDLIEDKPWPEPWGPKKDFWDQQPTAEMTPR